MAYDTNPMGGPTDAQTPDSGPQDTGSPDEGQQDGQGYTCFLPGDFPGAENLKAGDTLTLKVVGKDKDGDIEVQHMDESAEESGEDQGMMGHFDQEVGMK